MLDSVNNTNTISTRGVLREYIYFGLILLTNAMLIGSISSIDLPNTQFNSVYNVAKLRNEIIPFLVVYFSFIFISHLFLIGYIKSNAVRVSSTQFPEVFAIIESQAKVLGFKKTPSLYLLNGNGMINAFATRFGMRNYIVIYSSVFELAYKEGREELAFIIGHELGHLKRGHTSFIKRILQISSILVPFLNKAYSRACEYSCDRIGSQLSSLGASNGLLLLACGPELFRKINAKDYLITSQRDRGFATWLYEIFSTHPSLSKRIAAIDRGV